MGDRFFKSNFIFVANRYEEWQSGSCISKGPINTKIIAEVSGNEIHFELDDIGRIRMLKSFDFEILGRDYCILSDRIQYIHSTSDYNPIVPIVCNLFYNGGTIEYVRFAMTNPDRLVEFYGRLVEIGQPSTSRKTANVKPQRAVSAEKVFNELRGYGMLTSEAVMERAIKVYDDNFDVASIEQAKNMAEALKMFVKAYSLEKQKIESEGDWYEDEYEGDHKANPFVAKIMMFIAICNYKLNNIERAYCIAKQASDELDMALEQSPISIPKSMLGMDDLYQLISVIENNYADKVDLSRDYNEIDLTEIDTSALDAILGNADNDAAGDASSREYIYSAIKKYDDLRSNLMFSYIQGRKGAMAAVMMLHEFVCPLFYAWEYYGYGDITDFWKEDLPIMTYNRFKSSNVINEVRKTYNTITRVLFPFRSFDKDGSMEKSTQAILRTLIEDLENQ